MIKKEYFTDLKFPDSYLTYLSNKHWDLLQKELENPEQEAHSKNHPKLKGRFIDFQQELRKHTYYVIDPFNHLYNPAKTVKKDSKIYPKLWIAKCLELII